MEFIENNEELQPQQTLTEQCSLDKFCIFLTSTVYINPKKRFIFDTEAGSRLNTYLNSIKHWLDKTNFKIKNINFIYELFYAWLIPFWLEMSDYIHHIERIDFVWMHIYHSNKE